MSRVLKKKLCPTCDTMVTHLGSHVNSMGCWAHMIRKKLREAGWVQGYPNFLRQVLAYYFWEEVREKAMGMDDQEGLKLWDGCYTRASDIMFARKLIRNYPTSPAVAFPLQPVRTITDMPSGKLRKFPKFMGLKMTTWSKEWVWELNETSVRLALGSGRTGPWAAQLSGGIWPFGIRPYSNYMEYCDLVEIWPIFNGIANMTPESRLKKQWEALKIANKVAGRDAYDIHPD